MTDEIISMPGNIDAEQSLIGCLMLDDGSERCEQAMSMLKPESFFSRIHGKIFTTIKSMKLKSNPVDLLTLSDAIEQEGYLNDAGGFAYLAQVSKSVPSCANVMAYAMVIRDAAVLRYSIQKTNMMTELLYSRNGMSATEKLEAIQSVFSEITEHAKSGKRKGLRDFAEIREDWLTEVEKRFDPNTPRGVSSGIPSLDNLLYPKAMVRGSLFVIGARPKMGKTTLYGQMAIDCALNQNMPVLMFSLEMPSIQIFERMVGQASGVSTDVFYDGGSSDSDFARASKAALDISVTGNLYVDDTPSPSLSHVVSESRKIKRARGTIGLVMIDYLTLMKGEKADRNDLAYGEITKGLKNLAKELDCIVVLLTQLNRKLEDRADKRPLPSDSRDTGQIEQDCDYWLGIYRGGAYDENREQSLTELLLRLNRHGSTGRVYAEQKHGAIYDIDQVDGARRASENEEKRGGERKSGGY